MPIAATEPWWLCGTYASMFARDPGTAAAPRPMQHPSSAPALHTGFLDRAVPLLAADPRVVGVAVTGSYAEDAMDAFSDLDLVVACEAADHGRLMRDRAALAARLGPLVAAFTGEHVGEPRLMICLYGPPALHVDIKVVTLDGLAARVDEPVVLWEREGRMSAGLAAGAGAWPQPDPQWIEDRFWVWVHYCACRIARGELQDALDFLSHLRLTVLGPLGLVREGARPAGVRRVERHPVLAAQLAGTVGALERCALCDALGHAVTAYRELRPFSVECNDAAEQLATGFLRELAQGSPSNPVPPLAASP